MLGKGWVTPEAKSLGRGAWGGKGAWLCGEEVWVGVTHKVQEVFQGAGGQ